MAGIFGPVEQVPDRLVRFGDIKGNHLGDLLDSLVIVSSQQAHVCLSERGRISGVGRRGCIVRCAAPSCPAIGS